MHIPAPNLTIMNSAQWIFTFSTVVAATCATFFSSCDPWSPTVTHGHPLSPTVTVTHCHQLSHTVTHCHPLPPAVMACSSVKQFAHLLHQLDRLRVRYRSHLIDRDLLYKQATNRELVASTTTGKHGEHVVSPTAGKHGEHAPYTQWQSWRTCGKFTRLDTRLDTRFTMS